MRRRLDSALRATVALMLEPGETVQATGRARPGHVALAENAMGAVSAALSGGDWAMFNDGKDVFVVLTDRRLLVLEAHWLTFRPTGTVYAWLPRPLQASRVKRGFVTSFVLSAAGDLNALRLRFPRTERRDAQAILTALGVAPG